VGYCTKKKMEVSGRGKRVSGVLAEGGEFVLLYYYFFLFPFYLSGAF